MVTQAIRGGAYCSTSPAGGGTTSKQVALNTADTGYPYTTLNGNAVVVRGFGPIIITAQVTITSGYTCTATLQINGATVATGNTAQVSTLTYTYNASHSGDLLTLWETDSGFTAVNLTSGAANTFLHYEVPSAPPFPSVVFSRAAFV